MIKFPSICFDYLKSAFWSIANSDVHYTLSWDRLHAYHLGVFGQHLWPELKMIIEDLGRLPAKSVDER